MGFKAQCHTNLIVRDCFTVTAATTLNDYDHETDYIDITPNDAYGVPYTNRDHHPTFPASRVFQRDSQPNEEVNGSPDSHLYDSVL